MRDWFSQFSDRASRWVGQPLAFMAAFVSVLVWAVCGPVFEYSEGWQLTINTGTTIVTFLMVFLIQSTQNRDNAALHAKLDELIKSSDARNEFIGLDKQPEDKIERLRDE